MTENVKTLSFLGAALVVALVAVLSYPDHSGVDPHEEEGKKLFPDFTSPEAVMGIDIVKFDEAAASISRFKVAELDGVWSIATQENYPADAEDRVQEAATSVMGLNIVSFITDSAAEHVTYGVVEPDVEHIKVGSTGVGMMVTLLDSAGEPLTRPLIIGNSVKDREGLRYVRRAGQDAIYTVKVSTDKLSTKLHDWINRNLLELTPYNVKRLVLNDYGIITKVDQFRGRYKAVKDKARLVFSYEDAKWQLSQYEQVDKQGEMVPATLADDEEVDSGKLDDMKFALDDLKIVGVERKHEALADQFRSGKPLSDEKMSDEASRDLKERGFFAQPLRDGTIRIFSDAGDSVVGSGEGIEYVLRFGIIDPSSQSSDEKESTAGDEEATSELSLNRYVLVAVRLNTDLIDKPTFEEVPAELKTTEPAGKEKPAADKKPPAKDAPADKDTPAVKDADSDAVKKPSPTTEKEKDEDKEKDKDKDKEKDEEKDKDKDKDDEKEAAEARQRTIDANKRKQDDYDEKLKDAGEKVQKLNDRFASWYYIVSEDVYKKIRLGRDDVIKKKEVKKEDSDETESGDSFKFPDFKNLLPKLPGKK